MISLYFSGGYFSVPRNIMCSKKWANPDLPGSISLREPALTTAQNATRSGYGSGTVTTLRPLSRSSILYGNGKIAPEPEDAGGEDGAAAISSPAPVRRPRKI